MFDFSMELQSLNDIIKMSTSAGEFILGQYRIGKSIGEGTFGKVRLGIHMPTNQKVAVKTLQKEKIVEQADIQRVTRQICILKILRHPNVIQLYEIIQTKTDIHLIMEYAEGGELFDYIVKRKRLDEKEAVSIMQHILAGVEYIHKNGIVHRDLKPENLLMDHNKNIKIVDFGLSNQYKPGERLKTACGSPCYAAPQMIAGKRYECLGADVWSCGIILYAMLCGYLPFQDPNTSKLYKKIMAGQYQTPKILSTQSKDLLKGILNINPEARFKLEQIRDTRWFNQLGKIYKADGILVGKDQIEVDQRILKKMQKMGADPIQAKTYIINNKHNQVTALYYLLKIKAERDPQFLQQQRQKQKRQESPLIYKPDRKDYYLPSRKNQKQNKDSSKNDSMNVSNIISSLVQANKNRFVTGSKFGKNAKENNFDKVQDFKLFPNKKNSSIYEPKINTARSQLEKSMDTARDKERKKQKSLQSKQNFTVIQSDHSARGEQELNKKRQELSDQLRQISVKIDQEIHELRKQSTGGNTSTNTSLSKKRQSVGTPALSSRVKTQEASTILKSNNKEAMNTTKDNLFNSKDSSMFISKEKGKESNTKVPKVHSGPFNTQCIFMQNAKSMLDKITSLVLKHNMRYHETDPFCIAIGGGPQVAIQSIQGISGLHLVKFQGQHPLNNAIIQVLSK